MIGYIDKSKRPKSIEAITDGDGLIYLPEVGWLKTALIKQRVNLRPDSKVACGLSVFFENNNVSFTFENQLKIVNTPFEILNHQHTLLAPHYFDSKHRSVNVEIPNITSIQKGKITKAFDLISNHAPEYYSLLEQAIQKVVIFNDPSVKRNSFATLSVHGCAFFNSFQPEYDEVFFIEDIAHQCGHVIFNNMTHDNKGIFRVSPETLIIRKGIVGWVFNLLEKRTLFVAFHTLFTYYSITICLEAVLLKADLTALQKHEALGRLAFCFGKYGNDLKLLGKLDKNGNSIYFSEAGLELFSPMEAL